MGQSHPDHQKSDRKETGAPWHYKSEKDKVSNGSDGLLIEHIEPGEMAVAKSGALTAVQLVSFSE